MIRSLRARAPLALALLAVPLVTAACRTAASSGPAAAPTGRIESSGRLTGTDPITVVKLDAPAWVALVADYDVVPVLLHPVTETAAVRLKAGTHRIGRRQGIGGSSLAPASSRRCTRRGASGPIHAGDAARCRPSLGASEAALSSTRPARALLLVASSRPLRYIELQRALNEAARDGEEGTFDGFVARLGAIVGPGSLTTYVLPDPKGDAATR